MLPLAGTTCLIYGCGEIDSDLFGLVLRDTEHRLTVHVNRAAKIHCLPTPDVSVWIDGDIWATAAPLGLAVYDASVPGPETGISLPTYRKPFSRFINPGHLYHLPNTAAVAAMWAMAVGCELVAMIGCNCEPDGRNDGQLHSMAKARDKVLSTYQDVRLIQSPAEWEAWLYESRGMKRIHDDAADRLREFYR